MRHDRNGWALFAVALLILAALAAKGLLLRPADSKGDFSASQALGRLARVLGDERPHPVDSEANDAVRERLVAELRSIGLAPQVRDITDCSGFPGVKIVRCSRVRNVVAVLPGPQRPALLLNAHYDSTPTGPGAGDDGIGVAALIEVASRIKDAPRARPIILLFNESEEFGLNGASAFVEQDPLAGRVGKLINIEARGVSGPALMFETSRPNAAAIGEFAAATRRPYANSLSTDFATLIPNTTDVVKFRPAGWEILNYAIIGNETRYHSPGDDLAHLDRASVKHLGDEVLAATRQLAGPDRAGRAGTTVYADIGGRLFLNLPLIVAAITLGVLLLWALFAFWRRKAWRALGAVALAWAVSSIVGLAVAWASGFIRAGDYWRAWPLVPNLAAYATTLAVLAVLLARGARRNDRAQLRLASWLVTLAIGATASLFLPGASIYFLVGPALASAGITISSPLAVEDRGERREPPGSPTKSLSVANATSPHPTLPTRGRAIKWPAIGRALAIAGAFVQLFMFAEMLAPIEMLLIDGPLGAGAALAALAALPLLVEVARGANRSGTWTLAAIAAALWAVALLIPRASAERPQTFTIDYVRDDTRRTTQWAVNAKQAPLPASFARFGPWRLGELKYNERVRWLAKAPLLDIPAATVVDPLSSPAKGGRFVRFRVNPNGANAVTVRFGKDVAVLALGRPSQMRRLDRSIADQPSALACSGRSCGVLEFAALLATGKPVEATVISQSFDPPSQAARLIANAPRHSQPQYAPHGAVRVTGTSL